MKTGQAAIVLGGCEQYVLERTKGKHYHHTGDYLPKGTKKYPRSEGEEAGEVAEE